jgi:hypothetical protein
MPVPSTVFRMSSSQRAEAILLAERAGTDAGDDSEFSRRYPDQQKSALAMPVFLML